jgi:uncharacterized membrane protein
MNDAHLHLLLNHLPIVGLPLATIMLIHAVRSGNEATRKFAVALYAAVALTAVPAYLTGEPAEEVVENIQGVSEEAIEEHEDAGKWALIQSILTGTVAASTLVLTGSKRKWATRATFFFAVFAITSLARTGYLGGQVRHTEISNPPVATESHDSAGDESK